MSQFVQSHTVPHEGQSVLKTVVPVEQPATSSITSPIHVPVVPVHEPTSPAHRPNFKRFDYNRTGLSNWSDFHRWASHVTCCCWTEIVVWGHSVRSVCFSKKSKTKFGQMNLLTYAPNFRSVKTPFRLLSQQGSETYIKTQNSKAHWTDVFLSFSAIYLEKYPTEARHLL